MTETSDEITLQNLFAKLKQSFANRGFASNVATLLGGNISGEAIAFIVSPLITRLYVPDDFGSMTLIWSYVGILSTIACLRYENPVVIEKETNNAYNIFLLCIILASGFSLLLAGSIFLLGEDIANIIGLEANYKLLWFIPCGVFAVAINNSLTLWFTRFKNFFILSFCRISLSLFTAGAKITFGLLLLSSGGWLLAGNVLGLIGSIFILAYLFLKRDFLQFKSNASWKNIFNNAKKYSKFPKYYSLQGLLNSLSQNLPVMLFALYFSPQVVGFYGLANTILRRPTELLTNSLSKVFLQRVADFQAQGKNLRQDFLRTTIGLAAIGILPFGIIMIWGRYIFSVLFGAEWATAGLYAQILTPWLFMLLINPPSTQILVVRQKLKFTLYYDVANSILRVLVIIISYYVYSSPTVTIAFFSGAGVIANLYYMYVAYQQVDE